MVIGVQVVVVPVTAVSVTTTVVLLKELLLLPNSTNERTSLPLPFQVNQINRSLRSYEYSEFSKLGV